MRESLRECVRRRLGLDRPAGWDEAQRYARYRAMLREKKERSDAVVSAAFEEALWGDPEPRVTETRGSRE